MKKKPQSKLKEIEKETDKILSLESFKPQGIQINDRLPVSQAQNGGNTGWWEEGEDQQIGKIRIEVLKRAWQCGMIDPIACALAGISLNQLYYYSSINPEFVTEKRNCKMNLSATASMVIAKKIETDPELAWRYLAKKFPNDYGDIKQDGTINNFGTINTQINQEYVDIPDNIEELLEGDDIK